VSVITETSRQNMLFPFLSTTDAFSSHS